MLAGRPPAASSYDVHEHLFGIALRAAFEDDPELYAGCVGMNVWHFQCVAQAASAPEALRSFCEETTAELVAAMQPKNILRVGRQSFDALAREGRRVPGTRVLIGYFAKADIDPANALYTNALMGMKPGSAVGDVPTVPGYQDQCLMFLQRQIEIVQPRLVVALGKKARLCLTRIGVDAVYPLRPSARELKPKATRETIVSTQAKRFNTP